VKLTLASDWQKKNLIKKLKEMERRQNVDYGMPIYDSDDKDAMASIQDTHTHIRMGNEKGKSRKMQKAKINGKLIKCRLMLSQCKRFQRSAN